MIRAAKRIAKKIPFAYEAFKKHRASSELSKVQKKAQEIFENHADFMQAYTRKGEGLIDLKTRNGLSITIRQNRWDARIVKEVFFDRPYTRKFSLPENSTVVDIGGYIGDFSLYAVKYLNAEKVIVCEPTEENFELLLRNIKSNDFQDKITAINKAVGNGDEISLNVEIKDGKEVHASSFWYEGASTRVVPSLTLQQLLRENSLSKVDLLKVDCEGGEYEIFSSVDSETFARIFCIVFEYHPVNGFEEKLAVVLDRLKDAGYTIAIDGYLAYAWRS